MDARFTASEQEKLLVSSFDDPVFGAHREWLTSTEDVSWRSALAGRLAAELADEEPEAAAGVAQRAADLMAAYRRNEDHLTGRAIACRLLAEADASPPRLTLDQAVYTQLTDALKRAKLTCNVTPTQPDTAQH